MGAGSSTLLTTWNYWQVRVVMWRGVVPLPPMTHVCEWVRVAAPCLQHGIIGKWGWQPCFTYFDTRAGVEGTGQPLQSDTWVMMSWCVGVGAPCLQSWNYWQVRVVTWRGVVPPPPSMTHVFAWVLARVVMWRGAVVPTSNNARV